MILMQKLIAVILLVIPGIVSAYGWTLMRESIIFSLGDHPFPLFKFLAGLTLFFLGAAFIAGYFLRKEKRKRQPVMLKKKKPE
jgi:uncharacterized membrane protein